MNEALVKCEQLPITGMADLERLGHALAQSGMFGITRPAAGMVVAATCHQEGISLLEFQRTYHIVENCPSMRTDAMLARYTQSGGQYEILSRTPDKAECSMEIDGRKYKAALTWEEVKDEKYTKTKTGQYKDNWSTPRRRMQMLWARLVSDMIRVIAPQIVAGVYTPEETEDFTDNNNAQPRPEVHVNPNEASRKVASAMKDAEVKTPEPQSKPEDQVDASGMFKENIQDAEVEEDVDYTVCPLKPESNPALFGMKWIDMPDKTLRSAVENKDKYPELTNGYVVVINGILTERKKNA